MSARIAVRAKRHSGVCRCAVAACAIARAHIAPRSNGNPPEATVTCSGVASSCSNVGTCDPRSHISGTKPAAAMALIAAGKSNPPSSDKRGDSSTSNSCVRVKRVARARQYQRLIAFDVDFHRPQLAPPPAPGDAITRRGVQSEPTIRHGRDPQQRNVAKVGAFVALQVAPVPRPRPTHTAPHRPAHATDSDGYWLATSHG